MSCKADDGLEGTVRSARRLLENDDDEADGPNGERTSEDA